MRRHLTYANVVATLALVVAVGGGSTAIAISAKKAPKNSVTSNSIVDGSVTGRDLAGVRVETQFGASGPQALACQSGERLLSGGVGGTPGQIGSFGPTPDGNGYQRGSGSSGAVSIVCLRATPRK